MGERAARRLFSSFSRFQTRNFGKRQADSGAFQPFESRGSECWKVRPPCPSRHISHRPPHAFAWPRFDFEAPLRRVLKHILWTAHPGLWHPTQSRPRRESRCPPPPLPPWTPAQLSASLPPALAIALKSAATCPASRSGGPFPPRPRVGRGPSSLPFPPKVLLQMSYPQLLL